MAKQPKWTLEEVDNLIELLDKRFSYGDIAIKMNRSINGIKIAMSKKLHYKPMCLDCGKRMNRKGNRLRCDECAKKHNKKNKIEYSKKYQDYFRKLKNESRFGGNRELTFIRDKYTCQMCGKTHHEIMLDVHHIDKTGRNKKNHNNNLDNLITLCHSCHTKQHKEDNIMKRWQRKD